MVVMLVGGLPKFPWQALLIKMLTENLRPCQLINSSLSHHNFRIIKFMRWLMEPSASLSCIYIVEAEFKIVICFQTCHWCTKSRKKYLHPKGELGWTLTLTVVFIWVSEWIRILEKNLKSEVTHLPNILVKSPESNYGNEIRNL